MNGGTHIASDDGKVVDNHSYRWKSPCSDLFRLLFAAYSANSPGTRGVTAEPSILEEAVVALVSPNCDDVPEVTRACVKLLLAVQGPVRSVDV